MALVGFLLLALVYGTVGKASAVGESIQDGAFTRPWVRGGLSLRIR